MEYSSCSTCGKLIHRRGMGKPDDWFDDQGMLCKRPNEFSSILHEPRKESMTSYTEEEICKACKAAGYIVNPDRLLRELKKVKDTHVHDFTDTDTVTVKELREAFKRIAIFSISAESLLTDISFHRVPEYPAYSIWEDAQGTAWQRTNDGHWKRFGNVSTWGNLTPVRPLKRMDVVS